MKMRVLLVLVLALALMLLSSAGAWADSIHAGNTRSAGYGVQAYISTPATAPYVGTSGQSSWVSTAGPLYWVQIGWRYYNGYAAPKSYWEYSLPTGHDLQEMSAQTWNFTRFYTVTQLSGGNWQVQVNGTPKGAWGAAALSGPQRPVRAESESHARTVQLRTHFTNVKYRGQYEWFNFNENGWVEEGPYSVIKTSQTNYQSYGP